MLRLEDNLIIPQVCLIIFSSRLHLFTTPLPHSFSSLQNNAQPSLQHRKIVLSTLEIPPVSQVSEPYKHLHVSHCFQTLSKVCSVLPPCFPLTLKNTLCCGTGVVLHLTNTPRLGSRLPCSWCLLHGPCETRQPWPNGHLQEQGTGWSWAQTLLLAPGREGPAGLSGERELLTLCPGEQQPPCTNEGCVLFSHMILPACAHPCPPSALSQP